MLKRMLLREIRGSLGRYLALFAIIALGVGFFTGLRVTKSAMLSTEQQYLDEQNFYNFRLVSTLGFDTDAAETLRADARISDAEGGVAQDALIAEAESTYVLKFLSLPARINRPVLTAGRMPESPDECVVDAMAYTASDLGRTITLSPLNNADTLDAFNATEFTIVGVAASPLYINYERGSTSLGTGTLLGFAYLPRAAFTADYDTELYLTVPTTGDVYSAEYDAEIDALTDPVTSLASACADARYAHLRTEIQQELDDAQAEYDDGVSEYETQRADALAEIADAEAELSSARVELDDGWQQLADAEQTLTAETASAEQQLQDNAAALQTALTELYDGEDAYTSAVLTLNQRRSDWESGNAAYEAGLAEYNTQAAALETQRAALEAAMPRETLNAQLAAIAAQLGLPDADAAAAALETPAVAEAIGAETARALKQAVDGYAAIDEAAALLAASKQQLDATAQQLDAAKAQLDAGQAQLDTSRRDLDAGWAAYNDGLAQLEQARAEFETQTAEARQEIANNRQTLTDGEADYESGLAALDEARAEAEEAFSDAEAELADAAEQLADAQQALDDFAPPRGLHARPGNERRLCLF